MASWERASTHLVSQVWVWYWCESKAGTQEEGWYMNYSSMKLLKKREGFLWLLIPPKLRGQFAVCPHSYLKFYRNGYLREEVWGVILGRNFQTTQVSLTNRDVSHSFVFLFWLKRDQLGKRNCSPYTVLCYILVSFSQTKDLTKVAPRSWGSSEDGSCLQRAWR